jgi:subtilisin family serine protease
MNRKLNMSFLLVLASLPGVIAFAQKPGGTLLLGTWPRKILVLEETQGKVVDQLQTGTPQGLTLSYDKKTVYVSTWSNGIEVIDLATRKVVNHFVLDEGNRLITEGIGDIVFTGRGVRVAILDSGINPAHPHVAGVAGGVAITADGESTNYLDIIGHGTAVAGAIREKALDAELYAVKVFDRSLRTNADTIVRALDWAIEQEMHVVNWKCPRHTYRVCTETFPRFLASGFPRAIPGVPPEKNLQGISFAVANLTGFVVRAREAYPELFVAELAGRLAEAVIGG